MIRCSANERAVLMSWWVECTDVRSAIAAHYPGPRSLASDGATFAIEEG